MNAVTESRDARLFYRSEAFPEDVADFVEPSPQAPPLPQRPRHLSMLWLLGLLPLVALAIGVTWAL